MAREPVLIITDYFGQPVSGVVQYRGRPVHFIRAFDAMTDSYSDQFTLKPLAPETLAQMQEQALLLQRWRSAFDSGQASIDTHPALPGDRARYDELDEAIERALGKSTQQSLSVRGLMFHDAGAAHFSGWSVEWLTPKQAEKA